VRANDLARLGEKNATADALGCLLWHRFGRDVREPTGGVCVVVLTHQAFTAPRLLAASHRDRLVPPVAL